MNENNSSQKVKLCGTSIIKLEKDEAAKERSEAGEKSGVWKSETKGKLCTKNKVTSRRYQILS